MRKRVAAVAALSVLPLGLTAAPAHAAGSCSIVVPNKVQVSQPYRTIQGQLSSDCSSSDTEYASWDVMHPTQGFTAIYIFDGTTSDSLDWYDWEPLGTYTLRPSLAYDYSWDEVEQNTTTMSVRLASRHSATSARSGSYVTIKGLASRYSPRYGTYRRWSGAKVNLHQKSCSSCAWKYVTSATTNSYGQTSFKKYAPTARYWRVSTVNSSTTWGRSATVLKR